MHKVLRSTRVFLFVLSILLLFSLKDASLAQGTIDFPSHGQPPVFQPPQMGPVFPSIICPTQQPIPLNDNFANATFLSGNVTGICGVTVLHGIAGGNDWIATAEPGEPTHGGVSDAGASRSVWYRWTAPASGVVEITAGSMLVVVYTGDTLTDLVRVANAFNSVQLTTVAGQTYQIAIDQKIDRTYLGWLIIWSPEAFKLTIHLASIQLVAPNLSTDVTAGQEVNIEFAPFDDTESISELSLFVAGKKMSTLTNGPWQFNYIGTNIESAAIWAEGLNDSGQLIFAWPRSFTFRPPNDNFASAMQLSDWLSSGKFTASTFLATAEPNEPFPGGTVWWRWVAPYSAPTTVTLTSLSSELRVFQGSSLTSLQLVTSLQSSFSFPTPFPGMSPYPMVSFQAEAGTIYYFAAKKGPFSGTASTVSWQLSQQTLSLSPAADQRGLVGVPVEVRATTIETDRPPVAVQILLGKGVGIYGYPITFPSFPFKLLVDPTQIDTLGPLNSTNILFGQVWETEWMPQETGVYYVWARSTNSHGIAHESDITRLQINAANDDFVRPNVIPPRTTRTNLAFDLGWASSESSEPAHSKKPATRTLWWKWKPSYSGLVRLKAVSNDFAANLDIFTGTDFSNLRRIANNDTTPSLPGWAGVVRMQIKAGETYFIRVDDLNSMATGISNPGILTLEPALAPLAGTLNFSFFLINRAGWGNWQKSPQVLMPNCSTPVSGENFKAQLYVGLNAVSLKPVGTPQSFPPASSEFGGRVYPVPVIVPGVAPARMIVGEIRVWDSNYGETYEAAKKNGGATGVSNLIKGMTGSEESGPGSLLGLRSFCLQTLRH